MGLDQDAFAEAVAVRVVEMLDERSAPPAAGRAPLTARQVAERLGRSIEWVRDHRAELGLLGAEGPRPRLLFDPVAVDRWATACESGRRSPAADRPAGAGRKGGRRRRGLGTGGDLLPIRDDRRAA